MNVTVVTPAAGRHRHLTRQRYGLAAGTRVPDRHVVVAMADPDTPARLPHPALPTTVVDVAVPLEGLPLAAARNAGAAAALAAGADVLVFLDVDVVPDRYLVQRYADAVRGTASATVFLGPVAYLPEGVTDPATFGRHPFHPARPAPPEGVTAPVTDPDLFWSLSFALSRAAWDRVGGFDAGYVGYGGEDTDFAQRVLAAGADLRWLGGAAGYHQYHPVSSPPVEHLDDILRNGARFAARWGRWPMAGWLAAFEERGLVGRTDDGWERVSPPRP